MRGEPGASGVGGRGGGGAASRSSGRRFAKRLGARVPPAAPAVTLGRARRERPRTPGFAGARIRLKGDVPPLTAARRPDPPRQADGPPRFPRSPRGNGPGGRGYREPPCGSGSQVGGGRGRRQAGARPAWGPETKAKGRCSQPDVQGMGERGKNRLAFPPPSHQSFPGRAASKVRLVWPPAGATGKRGAEVRV